MFTFQHVSKNYEALIRTWLCKGHVSPYFYGQGLQNTLNDLDKFLYSGNSLFQHWIAFSEEQPFGYLMTSKVKKLEDGFAKWCEEEGEAITLDLLIGEEEFLGKGLSHLMIKEFLLDKFPHISEVLIDPELKNTRAIRCYEKAGFKKVEAFIPEWNPVPHEMMRLNMKELV